MRWGKFILLFQAIITLVFGMVFFMQVISLEEANIAEFNIAVADSIIPPENIGTEIIDIKGRYENAGYILLVVAIMEIVIISRFIG